MSEDVSEEEKTGYRPILSKLALVPTQFLPLIGKIIAVLIVRGQTLVPFLEKALADSMPKPLPAQPQSLIDIEGEYEIPELPGGQVDLSQLLGMESDLDYKGWGLENAISEPSVVTRVVITQAEDKLVLSRLINPTDPVENYLTQSQVDYLVRHLGDKIAKVTKAGVVFLFCITKKDEDSVTQDYYSFKVLGLSIPGKFRFAIRKASNPNNIGVPLRGAYIVKIITNDEVKGE